MEDCHLVGVLTLAVGTGNTLDVLLHAHQRAVEHHGVSGSQRNAVRCGRRLHDQHPWVRVGLEAVDDVAALGCRHAAVDALVGDALGCQVLLDGLDAGAEQREDDDLARCLLQNFLKHAKPWASVKLHHLFGVGQRSACRYLQQLTQHSSGIDRCDDLPCGLHQHLVLEQVVVLGLLRSQRHLAGKRHHWRQVKALVFGEADGWLQRIEHTVACIGLGCPLVQRDLVHHRVAPSCEEHRHVVRVDQLGQPVRIGRRLRCWCARHHPQVCLRRDDGLERLPSLGGHGLVGVGLIDNHQIKAAVVDDLLGNQVQPIVVADHELVVLLDHLNPARCFAVMRHDSRAVDDAVVQITEPCGVHDRQWAQYQHTLYKP